MTSVMGLPPQSPFPSPREKFSVLATHDLEEEARERMSAGGKGTPPPEYLQGESAEKAAALVGVISDEEDA